ncbi:MAG: histidine kinase dimerization/phospho-acceptor domain-containing protein, partial [Pseudolysinimonas sp.]
MRSAFGWARGLLEVDYPTPILKQLPTVLMTVVAGVVILTISDIKVTNPTVTLVGFALVFLTTIFAVVIGRLRLPHQITVIVPVVDLIALGAIRTGTGGSGSLFSALIILPIVWIAAKEGRKYILVAALGSSASLLIQFFARTGLSTSNLDLVRGIFSLLVFGFAAAIINELARQSRAQLSTVHALAAEREATVQRTSEYAHELEVSEAKFREADRMFRGVWAAVTEQSVIGTDVTGLIDAWNPGAQKLLGLPWEETEGKRYVFDFHVTDELNERARELNYPPGATVLNPGFSALVEMARVGGAESREWTYQRDDGTVIPVSLSVTKRLDDAGETVGYLFIAVDITQAREVAKLKDEFVGLISHELRTPLSSILGYLELIRDDEEAPLSEEQMRYLGVAERNAHRLLRLVGDLL